MILSRYEAETIISYNEEDNEAAVYTHNKGMMKKLLGYCKNYPDLYKLERQDENSKTFIIPKRYVGIRQPKAVSNELKEKLRNNAKRARENKAVLY